MKQYIFSTLLTAACIAIFFITVNPLKYPFILRSTIVSTLICINCAISSVFINIRNDMFFVHCISHMTITGSAIGLLLNIPILIGQTVLNILYCLYICLNKNKKICISTSSNLALALGIYLIYRNEQEISNLILRGDILSIGLESAIAISLISIVNTIFFLIISKSLIFLSTNNKNISNKKRILEVLYLISLSINVALASQIAGNLLLLSLVSYPGAIALNSSKRYGIAIYKSICISCIGLYTGMIISTILDIPLCCCMVFTLFIMLLIEQVFL